MGRKKIAPSFQMSLFNDPDLLKPEHDDMVEWTQALAQAYPERFDKFLDEIDLAPRFSDLWLKVGKEKPTVWRSSVYASDNREAKAKKFLFPICESEAGLPPPSPPTKTEKVSWEWPLRFSPNEKREVGFVDLRVLFKRQQPIGFGIIHSSDIAPELVPDAEANHRHKSVPRTDVGLLGEAAFVLKRAPGTVGVKNDELQIVDLSSGLSFENTKSEVEQWLEEQQSALVLEMGNNSVLDQKHYYRIAEVGWQFREHISAVYIEVKTEVPSKGELIRQLRFYHARGAYPLVVVAPPDDNLANLLNEQGFGFIPYQPGNVAIGDDLNTSTE
ncbi:MAG: hypothetical protein WD075_05620 [Rhodospirillales bacterium]